MDGMLKILGDGLAPARVPGEDAVAARVAGAALDMKLQLSVFLLHINASFIL